MFYDTQEYAGPVSLTTHVHTHTHTPLMQYINCTIRLQHNKVPEPSKSKGVSTKWDCNCLKWWRLEDTQPSKESYPGLQWSSQIRHQYAGRRSEFTFPAALILLDWQSDFVTAFTQFNTCWIFFSFQNILDGTKPENINIEPVTIWSESYFPFGWEYFSCS